MAGRTGVDDRDLARQLDELAQSAVNYDPADAPVSAADPRWHVDTGRALLGTERPGPPEPGGLWESACILVRDYEFTDHRRLRGIYRPGDPLLGRNMLLQGRFTLLRFSLGVRVTDVVDTEHDGRRVWGWAYETLSGHLEQGRLSYEVVKNLANGEVTFWIRAYSRRAPVPNPLYRFGFALFGRPIQLEFYHRAGQRIRDAARAHRAGAPLPRASTDRQVVVAPQGSSRHWWDRLVVHVHHPGA